MTTFTKSPWSSPESDLTPEEYAKVCLIDMSSGKGEKTKAMMKLPIRATPGGPVNVNGMHAAAGALSGARGGLKGVSPEKKRAAAKKLISLYRQAGEIAPEHVYRIAGERRPADKKS